MPSVTINLDFFISNGYSYMRKCGVFMETRVAVIGIIVEDMDSVEKLNAVLHDYGPYIIGRMGVPYHKKDVAVIQSLLKKYPNIKFVENKKLNGYGEAYNMYGEI